MCVLNLSCAYAYVVLAVLVTVFLACVAIFYIERRQRASFPYLPDGRVVESPAASPRAWKPPGAEARLLSAAVLRDTRDGLGGAEARLLAETLRSAAALRDTRDTRDAFPPTPTISAGPTAPPPDAAAPHSVAELYTGSQLAAAGPPTTFSSRGLPPRAPPASTARGQLQSVTADASPASRPLGVGTEVVVVALDEHAVWCGRWGSHQAWFTYSDNSPSELSVSVGDIVTVVGLRLSSWCGASRGMTANFTLPATAIGRAPSAFSTPRAESSQSL